MPALAAILVLHWIVLAGFWTGVGGADHYEYAMSALDLSEGQLPDTHWGLRWPLTGTMALSVLVLGPTEFALSLPVILSSSGLVLLAYLAGRRWAGPGTGLAAALMVATSPLFAVMRIHVHLPEMLFAVAAVIVAASADGTRLRPFAVAALLAWLAWACRETSGYLPVALGLGAPVLLRPVRRGLAAGLTVGGGFAAAVLAEWTFYRVIYGDWLYRVKTDLDHGGDMEGTGIRSAPQDADTWLTPLFDAVLPSLLTPVYAAALLGGIAAPVLGFGWRPEGRRGLVYLGIGCALSYTICVGFLNLESYRYFSILPLTGTLVAAWSIASFGRGRGRPAALTGLALICALGIGVRIATQARDSTTPYRLAEAALTQDAVVNTPYNTRHARLLLRLRGSDPDLLREIDGPDLLTAGDLVLVSDDRAWPAPSWTPLATYPPNPGPIDRLRGDAEAGQTLWRVGE